MRLIFLLLAAGLLASCKTATKPGDPATAGEAAAGGLVPAGDVAIVNAYFTTNKTNGMLPATAQTPVITPANSKFIVDLDGQRTYFYVDNKLTAAATIASGRRYYRTETGDFTVGQKDLNHRSSSYGNFVSKGGRTLMGDVKNGFDPTPPGARFEGSLMKYFLRFHRNGSHTEKMAAWFFSKVPSGTPILVRGKKNGVAYGASQGRPKRSPKVHSSLKDKPVSTKPADPGPEATTTPPAGAPETPTPAPTTETPSTVPDPAPATPSPEATPDPAPATPAKSGG